MPLNFRYIPLIRALFPNSKIIHVVRDPRATCWSNFKNLFESDSLPFSYDIEIVVKYYQMYSEMMKCWVTSNKYNIHNIKYENLVLNPKNEISGLLSFLGLSWQEGCLNPHKNKRLVKTASSHQIRDEIYQNSSES